MGGERVVDAAVDLFCLKVLVDDRIRHFFDGIPVTLMHGQQKKLLTMALGGPIHYDGPELRSHAHYWWIKWGSMTRTLMRSSNMSGRP